MAKSNHVKEQFLWRYTKLKYVVNLLKDRKLLLRSSDDWQDKNDSYFMKLYKAKRKYKSVLAICLTRSPEKFHFWKSFTDDAETARVKFKKDILLEAVKRGSVGFRHGNVTYRRVDSLAKQRPKISELPFIKRLPYKDEKEYRIIYRSRGKDLGSIAIPIPIASIAEITLGPRITLNRVKLLKGQLRKIPGCASLRIGRSTVEENQRWKDYGQNASE
jgi:hypothetical protein